MDYLQIFSLLRKPHIRDSVTHYFSIHEFRLVFLFGKDPTKERLENILTFTFLKLYK